MSRKLLNVLAVAAVLTLSTTALAQDEGVNTQTLITSLSSVIGIVASILWLILFASWGGFRYVL